MHPGLRGALAVGKYRVTREESGEDVYAWLTIINAEACAGAALLDVVFLRKPSAEEYHLLEACTQGVGGKPTFTLLDDLLLNHKDNRKFVEDVNRERLVPFMVRHPADALSGMGNIAAKRKLAIYAEDPPPQEHRDV